MPSALRASAIRERAVVRSPRVVYDVLRLLDRLAATAAGDRRQEAFHRPAIRHHPGGRDFPRRAGHRRSARLLRDRHRRQAFRRMRAISPTATP